MIDFPASPIVGQFYPSTVGAGERQWLWNGSGWERLLNSGQVPSVFVRLSPYDELVVDVFPVPFGFAQWVLLTYT